MVYSSLTKSVVNNLNRQNIKRAKDFWANLALGGSFL
jgi:hypothetical protein